MNYSRRRDHALSEAVAEHRRREDAAPRLSHVVPLLQSLRMAFSDVREEGRILAPPYVRPVVVATAPAHFEIRCMESKCDGKHDLTARLLDALQKALPNFSGQSRCDGMVGDVPCDRILAYACDATYKKG